WRARRVRYLAGLRRVHRLPGQDAFDRGVHPGLVVGAAAFLVRDGRGEDLRCPVDRPGVRGAGRSDRGLRLARGARRRCGAAVVAETRDTYAASAAEVTR